MPMFRSLPRLFALLVGLAVATGAALAQTPANPPLLLRSPSVSETTLAFRYADDIWTVSRDGGAAELITLSKEAGDLFVHALKVTSGVLKRTSR